MEFYEVIKKRRSIRRYEDKPIPVDSIVRIMEAARLAPSATNRQPWKFIIIDDEEIKQKLARASFHQTFIKEAPLVIAAVALEPERIMSCGIPSYAVDLAIAVEHIVLAACNEGLGSCWIGAFDQSEVKKILQIPEKYKVVALLPIGFPRENPPPRPRKPLNEILSYNRFGKRIQEKFNLEQRL